MNIPEGLLYTKDHEWVKIEGDTATIGITDFAQGELGDIVYVEVDTLDESVEQEAVFGTVEAVKTVSDLFMPLSGTVVEWNSALEDTPEKVNEDPYGEGWMIKITLDDSENTDGLLSAEEYQALISQRKTDWGLCFSYSACKIKSRRCGCGNLRCVKIVNI